MPFTVFHDKQFVDQKFIDAIDPKAFKFLLVPSYSIDFESQNIIQKQEDVNAAIDLGRRLRSCDCLKKSTTADGISFFIIT